MTTDNACIGWYWLRSIVSCTTDDWYHVFSIYYDQKQGSRGVLIKICSENMQQNYRRTPVDARSPLKVDIKNRVKGISPISSIRQSHSQYIYFSLFTFYTCFQLLISTQRYFSTIFENLPITKYQWNFADLLWSMSAVNSQTEVFRGSSSYYYHLKLTSPWDISHLLTLLKKA